tara:strand:- start:30554 stop:30985 length:432 start_codon:yes stop_codon:yes gene_type:complete
MVKHSFLLLILFFFTSVSYSQDTTDIFSQFTDNTDFKVVIKTQNFNGTEDIALDNFTIKKRGAETKIYYIRYGDMLISSLTVPYSILDRFIKFEKHVRSVACKSKDCKDSILFDDGKRQVVIPIDILYEELVGSLMLELEQKD